MESTQESTYDESHDYGNYYPDDSQEYTQDSSKSKHVDFEGQEEEEETPPDPESVPSASKERKSSKKRRHRHRHRDSSSGKRKKRHGPFYFEQLGVPCLVYQNNIYTPLPLQQTKDCDANVRNFHQYNTGTIATAVQNNFLTSTDHGGPPWASIGTSAFYGQTDYYVKARMMHTSLQKRWRAQARWYYPMDYPVRAANAGVEAREAAERHAKFQAYQKKQRDRARIQAGNDPETTFYDRDIPTLPSHKPSYRNLQPPRPKPKPLSEQQATRFVLDSYALAQKTQGRAARQLNKLDPLRGLNPAFLKSRVLGSIDRARSDMLAPGQNDDNDLDHLAIPKARPAASLEDIQHDYREGILRGHRMFDTHYVPVHWRPIQRQGLVTTKACVTEERMRASQKFAEQRRQLADPAYLAPVPEVALQDILEQDMAVRNPTYEKATPTIKYDPRNVAAGKPEKRDRSAVVPNDTYNPPKEYGNCLVCIPCTCPTCSSAKAALEVDSSDAEMPNNGPPQRHPNMCLLHPIGPIFDTLAASTVRTPYGSHVGAFLKTNRNFFLMRASIRVKEIHSNELNMGDSIRQILQIGNESSHMFLVRTSLYVSVVSVLPAEDTLLPLHLKNGFNAKRYTAPNHDKRNPWVTKEGTGPLCWGNFAIQELQRIDLRSFGRRGPSYTPVDVTSNPTFSGSLMANHQYKFAILSFSKHGRQRNVIHHFLWAKGQKMGGQTSATARTHVTKHEISSLKVISEIAFTPRHPMVLWALAVSWIRPALTKDFAVQTTRLKARVGEGYSLYTIDLRTNEATFQWSPSGAEFLVEGVHSLSGMTAEWKEGDNRNHLWVSSISCGKVWELDGQLYPIRVLNSFSLPGICNDFGPTLPKENGIYGCGTLFARPKSFCPCDTMEEFETDLPVLSIDKNPEFYGLSMYQRPAVRPRFQLDSLEVTNSSALIGLMGKKHGFSMSSIYKMPKTKRDVFWCGIAAVSLPVASFLTDGECQQAGIKMTGTGNLLCTFSLNSSGDVFTHNILGSRRGVGEIDGTKINAGEGRCQMQAKLAGGLTLPLYLASSPAPPMVSSISGRSDERFVRPFRYLDLRYLPSQPRQKGEKIVNNSVMTVLPQITSNDMTLRQGGTKDFPDPEDAHLEIPVDPCFGLKQQHLASPSAHLLLSATEPAGPSPRSDVSMDILNTASEEWGIRASSIDNHRAVI